MNVSHLKAGSFPRKSTRAEGRYPTLVRNFGQGVGLIEELRKLARSEKGIDDGRERTRIDQVDRCEHLIIPYVHPFPDRTRHPRQTDAELCIKLFA